MGQGFIQGQRGIDTSDATAVAADIASGKTAYVASGKITGTKPSILVASGTVTSSSGTVSFTKKSNGGTINFNSITLVVGFVPKCIIAHSTISADSPDPLRVTLYQFQEGFLSTGGKIFLSTIESPAIYSYTIDETISSAQIGTTCVLPCSAGNQSIKWVAYG